MTRAWAVRFFKAGPEIFHAASGKFDIRLNWTHYRILLQVNAPKVLVLPIADSPACSEGTFIAFPTFSLKVPFSDEGAEGRMNIRAEPPGWARVCPPADTI